MQARGSRRATSGTSIGPRVRALVGARIPQGLLERIRVMFCLFAVFNVLLVVPAVLAEDRGTATAVGLAAGAGLALLWIRVLRRGHFDLPSRAIEPFLVGGLAWGAVEPESILGAFYIGLYFGALYGSRPTTMARGVMYFLAFGGVLLLDGGRAAVGSPHLWAHAWGAILSSFVISLMAAAVRGQEASALAKDEFLSVVSHELRTPLTSLLGLLHTLELHDARLEPERRRHLVTRARANAERQRQLVDDLLDVSRATRGTLQPDPAPVHVASLVAEVTDALDVPPSTQVQVPDHHVAHVDGSHLHQILSNLLTNAGKYGAPPVDITSTLLPGGGALMLQVRDRGRGVSPQFLPALFERFSQESTGDRRTASGVGLGLWIARELAQANGGDIEYEDAAPGARFIVVLPTADAGVMGG